MTDRTRYWIWLVQGVGYASPKPRRVASLYKDVKTLYEGGEAELRFCGIFTESEISRLLKTPLSAADKIIARCNELGFSITDISEETYPQKLLSIEDPPAVLYIDGTLPDIDSCMGISVIGTRKATVYGVRTAFELGANLSNHGFVVISGGALGIDCAAHKGVLQSEGVTVCVLGCGINYDYLKENKSMRIQIAQRGAVISEYPPDTPASTRNFPQRNRIISGLCDGLVVVEAPKASGSMITVGCALSQSRDVFSVMGNVDSPYSEGTNTLIKEGAVPVTSYKDIVEYYRGISKDEDNAFEYNAEVIDAIPTKLRSAKDTTALDNHPIATHINNLSLSEDESKVYYSLGQEPVHVDKISEFTGVPVHLVLRILSTLEMNDLVSDIGGRNYVIK